MKTLALAMTWDGARWPVRNLPVKARAFLGNSKRRVPSARELAKHFASDQITELRICWVPRLKGGPDVLSAPFQTASGTRAGFRTKKVHRFGDVLGVEYRRS